MRCALFLSAVIASGIAAADSGFYAGAAIGYANYDRDIPANGFPGAPLGNGFDFSPPFTPPYEHPDSFSADPVESLWGDGDGMAWRLFGGYRFGSRFAVEAAYVDLAAKGDRHAQTIRPVERLTPPDFVAVNAYELDVPVSGATLSGVMAFPVTDRVAVTARIGALYWDADLEIEEATLTITCLPQDSPACVSSVTDRTERGQRKPATGRDYGFRPALGAGVEFRISPRMTLRGDWTFYHDVAGDDLHTIDAGLQFEF